jgi:tetratricopeptide (TPR) repeat protein
VARNGGPMKKKVEEGLKGGNSNSQKTKGISGASGRVLHMNHTAQPKRQLSDDPHFAQSVQSYEAGLRALQERKFEKAKALFQKVVASGSRELADRAGVHLNTCTQHLERGASTSFKTVEEHFDYSISLMNLGDYIAAREHLEKLIKQAPQADYVHYGLAALACLTARYEDSLRHLDDAIRLNPNLRYQARNDSDFQNLTEDPRFTELLYPETGTEPSPSPTASETD